MPIWMFSWCKLTNKTEFLKQIFQKILNFYKEVLYQNLMLCKESASKSDGWQKSWFKIWYCSNFLNQNCFFFHKNVSLRMKLSKTARKCQLCRFYSLRRSKKNYFLHRIFKWFLIFYKHFAVKFWRVTKYWFKIWIFPKFSNQKVFLSRKHLSQSQAFQDSTKVHTLLFLQSKAIQIIWFFKANIPMIFDFLQTSYLQNLMHCKSFGLYSDGCYEGYCEYWPTLEFLILNSRIVKFGAKSDTFQYFGYKIWRFLKNWWNLTISEILGSNNVFFPNLPSRNYAFQ